MRSLVGWITSRRVMTLCPPLEKPNMKSLTTATTTVFLIAGALHPTSLAAQAAGVNTIGSSVTPSSLLLNVPRAVAVNSTTVFYSTRDENRLFDVFAYDIASGSTSEILSDRQVTRLEANDDYLAYSTLVSNGRSAIDVLDLNDTTITRSIGEQPSGVQNFYLNEQTIQFIDSREQGPFSRGPGAYSTDLRTGNEIFLDPRGIGFTEIDPLTSDVFAYAPFSTLISPRTGETVSLHTDGVTGGITDVRVAGRNALVETGNSGFGLAVFDIAEEEYTVIVDRNAGLSNLEPTITLEVAAFVDNLNRIRAFDLDEDVAATVYDARVQNTRIRDLAAFGSYIVWNEEFSNGVTAVRFVAVPEPTAAVMFSTVGLLVLRRRR